MPIRRILIIAVLVICLVVDGIAWFATYRIVQTPSVEAVQATQAIISQPKTAIIEQSSQSFHTVVSLNGEWLYKQTGQEIAEYPLPETDTSRWHTMEIPRNWYLEGLNYHGVIWFRRVFTASEEWKGCIVNLVFDGVDYFAEVWVNGIRVGSHAGYFEPFTLDITEEITYDQPNVLVVRVDSPYEVQGVAWPANKTLIKGIFGQNQARPGGAWDSSGQEYNTGGIWNDVRLEISSFLTVDALKLQAAWNYPLPTFNLPEVKASVSLYNYSDAPADVEILVRMDPDNFEGDPITLPSQVTQAPPGRGEVTITGMAVRPALWWTWDRGQPNLYRVTVRVTMNGNVVAEKHERFGFREVKVDEGWTWKLNGVRFFVRGTNYASTQWLSQADRELLEGDINLIRQANLNFVRVYAHVEPMEFYDLADEAGLLVWQDFPLQWAYSEAPEFITEAQRQMEAMVNLLFNHPSIAVWCAHNESPWANRQLSRYISGYDARQNKRLDELLQARAQILDPTRYVHQTSGTGDAHVYPGWEDGSWKDYENLPGQPFVSEFGAQALPGMRTMFDTFDPLELNYRSGEVRTRWEFHDFQYSETFNVAKIDPGIPGEGYDRLETFIKNSQAYQANLLQFAIETYRRAKYDPMQGIVQFMLVDQWPSITWSVLDYARNPKPGYTALQTAMQPVLPSIRLTQLPAELDGRYWVYPADSLPGVVLWVVNDTLQTYPSTSLSWRIVNPSDLVIQEGEAFINIQPDEASSKTTLSKLELAPGKYRLIVQLESRDGVVLGTNLAYIKVVTVSEETPAP
jgi:beta-mannosidase